jgi:hypothetical protein
VTKLIALVAIALVVILLPVWLIVRLINRIPPKKPDKWDNMV